MKSSWLHLSASAGAHRLALEFLDQAAAARRRLDDPADGEALHDFRVALRRLRSCEQAYRPQLRDAFPAPMRRALKRLADATNPGRDSEVQAEWLEGQRERIDEEGRPGFEAFLRTVAHTRDLAYAGIRKQQARDFDALAGDLHKRLKRGGKQASGKRGGDFAAVSAVLIRAAAQELHQHLGLIHDQDDETEAHAARIRGKRLRYLLEPFRDHFATAVEAVQGCKRLQDILGDLHDAHVILNELRDTVADGSALKARRAFDLELAGEPDPQAIHDQLHWPEYPGLIQTARLARGRCTALFDDLIWEFLGRRGEALFQAVEKAAAELEAA